MNVFMRYFDGLTAPLFKTDAGGRALFFPAGIWSKGRLLPDAATAAALRARVRRLYVAMFLVAIPILVIVAPIVASDSWLPVIVGGLAIGLGFNAYLFHLARDLPSTGERLTLKEAQAAQAQAMGRGWLTGLALALGLGAVTVGGLAVADPKEWLLAGGLGCAVFAAGASLLLRLSRGVKRS